MTLSIHQPTQGELTAIAAEVRQVPCAPQGFVDNRLFVHGVELAPELLRTKAGLAKLAIQINLAAKR